MGAAPDCAAALRYTRWIQRRFSKRLRQLRRDRAAPVFASGLRSVRIRILWLNFRIRFRRLVRNFNSPLSFSQRRPSLRRPLSFSQQRLAAVRRFNGGWRWSPQRRPRSPARPASLDTLLRCKSRISSHRSRQMSRPRPGGQFQIHAAGTAAVQTAPNHPALLYSATKNEM